MIVSCGEALVDMVPDAVIGGGPLNVAVAAARQGAPSAFVGGVSLDAHGDAIWSHLGREGVDLRLAERFDAPTARAIVEHVPELRFRFEGDGTADTLLGDVDLDALDPSPHLVHGGTLGLFRGRTARSLADLAERHRAAQVAGAGGLISLDPNIRPQIIDDRDEWDAFHRRWLACTQIYKGSDEDLDWIFPGRSPEAVAEELLASGVVAVIVTRGADGLSVLTEHGDVFGTAPEVEIVDTVGAGDTIVATVLAALWTRGATDESRLRSVSSQEWQIIADRAVVAAGITCTRAGADVPTAADIDAALAS